MFSNGNMFEINGSISNIIKMKIRKDDTMMMLYSIFDFY